MTSSYTEMPLPPEWGKLKRKPEPVADTKDKAAPRVSMRPKPPQNKLIGREAKMKASPEVLKSKPPQDIYLDRLLDSGTILKGIVLSEALGPPRCRKKNPYKLQGGWGYSKNDK